MSMKSVITALFSIVIAVLIPLNGLAGTAVEAFLDGLDEQERQQAQARVEWVNAAALYLETISPAARDSMGIVVLRQAAGLSVSEHPALREAPPEHLLEGRFLMIAFIHPFPQGSATKNGRYAYAIATTISERAFRNPEAPGSQHLAELALVFAIKGAFVDFHSGCVLQAQSILDRLAWWSRERDSWKLPPLVLDWKSDFEATWTRLNRMHRELNPNPEGHWKMREFLQANFPISAPPEDSADPHSPTQQPTATLEERVELLAQTTLELILQEPPAEENNSSP